MKEELRLLWFLISFIDNVLRTQILKNEIESKIRGISVFIQKVENIREIINILRPGCPSELLTYN